MSDSPTKEDRPPPGNEASRVFVSYAHESPEHKNWVQTLATDLRRNGVDALLDIWKVRIGGDFTLFMEEIRTCDRVLLICTPAYARKANEGEGGVGYERSVITGELAKTIATAKFICVLRDGAPDESVPTFARSRRYIDFRNDEEYEVRVDELVRDLHNAPVDPEPLLGRNPFAVSASPAEIDQEADTGRSMDETDPAEIAKRAETLLSRKDFLGWKRLVRRTRKSIEPRLAAWRQRLRDEDRTGENWPRAFAKGIEVCEPLLVLALTAVDSEIESVRYQHGLIDEFLSMEAWERSGHVVVAGMPLALAFTYHHVLGAFFLASDKHHEAIRLLSIAVRTPAQVESHKLWQDRELMGWPASLGKDWLNGWEFLRGLYGVRSWMRTFFQSQSSFMDSLRAYTLVASMLELSAFLGEDHEVEKLNALDWLDVPPMFVMREPTASSIDLDKIVSRAIPDRSVLDEIAETGSTSSARVREAWPTWISRWAHELSPTHELLAFRLKDLVKQPPPLP